MIIPDAMFDFQKHIAEQNIIKGRYADFLDTGLGKTIIQITTAYNYVLSLNKPSLIITPLAVAFQFIKEAEKFGINDVEYSKTGKWKHGSKIIICNYERLHYFNAKDFDCVICDESSILKNFEGAIKHNIVSFLKKVKYRFLFTATPSPNNYEELGNSSEALGILGYMDMLGKFFTNNEDTISPLRIGTEWRLKGHAEEAFFDWVSSWSISMRKPSDLGFSDEKFILPELKENYHYVRNNNVKESNRTHILFGEMIDVVAKTQTEVRREQKETIVQRCEKAAELCKRHKTSVVWCNLNPEGDLLQKIIPGSIQLKGSMPLEEKEEILIAFSNGEIDNLITKPKITAFGLNWQHCGHTVFFPTFSYEQKYQAIRRFWRFGRKEKVVTDIVCSNGMQRVIDSIMAKEKKAIELFEKLNRAVNRNQKIDFKEFNKEIIIPNFLKAS